MKFLKSVILFFFPCVLFAQGVSPEVVLTTGHNTQIHAMDVSDDGRFLASSDNNKVIKIWEVSKAMEYRSIGGTNGYCFQLTFSPDNIHLAITTTDGELIVYNVLSGEKNFSGRASSNGKGLYFFDDNKKIVHIDENNHLAISDVLTGELFSFEDVYAMSLVTDVKQKKAYVLDHQGNLIYVDLSSRSVIKTVKLFNEFNYPFSRGTISKEGNLIAWGFNDDKLRFFDVNQEKFVFTSSTYKSKLIDLEFDEKNDHLYLATHGGVVQILDYKQKKVVTEFSEPTMASQCITGHPDGDILFFGNMSAIKMYNKKTGKVFRELKGRVSGIVNMSLSSDGNYVAVATDRLKIQIWDLRLNKVAAEIQGFFPCEFMPDGKHLVAMNYTLTLGIWDIETGQLVKELPTNSELIQCLAVSKDGKQIAGAGFLNEIRIWDFESSKKMADLKGHTAGIICLDFHPQNNLLASGGYDNSTRVWDINSKKQIQIFEDQPLVINSIKFSPDGKSLATSSWDKTIKIRSTENWSTIHNLEGHTNMITAIDFNKDGSVLVSSSGNNSVWQADNSLIFWNVSTGKEICKSTDHQSAITKVVFDKNSNRTFSTSEDGFMKLIDFETCNTIANYLAIDGKEFMIYTPDNYYMASKNALTSIAFRLNGEMVSFDQFDIFLNRPDVVASRIGKSPEQLIKAYEYLHKKRLKKMQIDEGAIQLDYKIPRLINETEVPLVTERDTLKIWIKAWDDTYKIKQINAYVNSVPVFGENGFEPSTEVSSLRAELKIPLMTGVNKIQLSAINSNGAESVYETIEIVRENNTGKSNLYVAAIGVSDYKDTRFNLTYPTKDAKDVVTKLAEASSLYNQVKTKFLLNEEVTISGFESLNDFFSTCTHEDLAIIFIAGHGVLNVNFDYFFATYDMDFDQPEKAGLSYEKIHTLMSKIKAYRKLLIMDTCHSGELDKDEIETGPEPEMEIGGVEFRSAGTGVRMKEGFGFENSLKLVEDIFSETQKGSGAIVISSAGGAEYAMESDQWKNGLFTYALISGLTQMKADVDYSGTISVSEIRAYVNAQVTQLSGGKQIPSSREENISMDYIIFGN